ncbi:class I SAM-dependent methyltransferase [Candidatus Microgenomates bacterium]|nr:class I SAM-dependent methyltransferase [Candidatus Microgenomates bacterium]
MNSTIEFIGKRFGVDVTSISPIKLAKINRTILAQVFGELGFKTGAEIGVAEGVYSKVLCDAIPGLKLFCIDIWEQYPGYTEYKNPEQTYAEAKERLQPYNCVFIRKFSMDAARDFADNSLDFVFIDGAHDFKNVACDICDWSKKVKPGGIVFGHDYKYHQTYIQKTPRHYARLRHAIEVKVVVDAYCFARSIRPWFQLYPEIEDPTFGPDNPCWMFVRQEGDSV